MNKSKLTIKNRLGPGVTAVVDLSTAQEYENAEVENSIVGGTEAKEKCKKGQIPKHIEDSGSVETVVTMEPEEVEALTAEDEETSQNSSGSFTLVRARNL